MWLLSRIIPLCALLLSFLSGCGYTLNHRLKDTFESPKKGVFVPVFTNSTEEVGAEIVFTNALIRELESHGEKTVSSKELAGLEIRGTITQIQHVAEKLSDTGYKGERLQSPLHDYARVPDQIGVRVYIQLEVWDTTTDKLRWSNQFSQYRRVSAPLSRISDWDAPSSLGLITQSIVESSYPDIARDIMRDLYDQMVDI